MVWRKAADTATQYHAFIRARSAYISNLSNAASDGGHRATVHARAQLQKAVRVETEDTERLKNVQPVNFVEAGS